MRQIICAISFVAIRACGCAFSRLFWRMRFVSACGNETLGEPPALRDDEKTPGHCQRAQVIPLTAIRRDTERTFSVAPAYSRATTAATATAEHLRRIHETPVCDLNACDELPAVRSMRTTAGRRWRQQRSQGMTCTAACGHDSRNGHLAKF